MLIFLFWGRESLPEDPVVFAIPFFVLSLILEYLLLKRRRAKPYNLKDAFTSIGMGLGNLLITVLFAGLVWQATRSAAKLAPISLPRTWWTWALLFIAEDFVYYWFHRLSHEVRIWWAAHVNHHSSTAYNLSTALRQNWSGAFLGTWLLWLPLALLGFPPEWILIEKSISLIYQYWIHTELVDRLPAAIEFVFNTPSHHRVHHGKNINYLDCNYGGILIIWDRIFGSFVPENRNEPVIYGLTKDIETYNLWKIATHELSNIFSDLKKANTLNEMFFKVFGPPGWSADGSTKTAQQMKAELTKN